MSSSVFFATLRDIFSEKYFRPLNLFIDRTGRSARLRRRRVARIRGRTKGPVQSRFYGRGDDPAAAEHQHRRRCLPALSSVRAARCCSDSGYAGSIVGPASRSTTRAVAGSMRRKLWRSERRANSAICPANSTPVGPAPTTTKVSQRRCRAGSDSRSAISKAPKIRPRSSSASSIVFIPGA